jgi:hypothetical protein
VRRGSGLGQGRGGILLLRRSGARSVLVDRGVYLDRPGDDRQIQFFNLHTWLVQLTHNHPVSVFPARTEWIFPQFLELFRRQITILACNGGNTFEPTQDI